MTDQERAIAHGTWAMKNTPMCATCVHYVQHYIDCGSFFKPINAGHCTMPRIRNRLPYNLCERYTPNEDVKQPLYCPKGFNYTVRKKED